MHDRDRKTIQVIDKPTRIKNDVDITGSLRVIILCYCANEQIIGKDATLQSAAGYRERYAWETDQFISNCGFKRKQVDI